MARFCGTCGAPLADNARVCGQCGAPVARFCGNCGAELVSGARVCGQCGRPVEAFPQIPAVKPAAKPADPAGRRKAKKTLTLVCILAVVIAAAILAINIISGFTGCKGLVRKVMKAYEAYDIDTLTSLSSDAYYYASSDWADTYFEYTVGDHLDDFESAVGANYKLSYEVQEIYTVSARKMSTVLDDIETTFPDYDTSEISKIKVAEVEVTAKRGGSSTSRVLQITMAKENGDWKLLYID